MAARLEIPEWLGARLTAGAFSQYVERVVGVFTTYGKEALLSNYDRDQLETLVKSARLK